ncbi:AmmeMemoRadiSam system radical SAM enzyme [Candidatus Woesearchaeota archaeon]|nr:AmmeMemoRadiSam system radical SAM enzyme [Candidatus Woesearchaeota archaeon]
MKECVLYEPTEKGGSVRCKACSHRCIIADGKRGICGVRQNRAGKLYLLVYDKVVAMHMDPMEKKPLYHFLPGTSIMSIGTVGCNFRCDFCQNWEISQAPKNDGPVYGENVKASEIVSKAKLNGCSGIAYTYNEPAIFIEFAHDVAMLARAEGLKNVYVSNGYETEEALKYMRPYIDAINIDLKSFSDDFYRKLCGARLQPVLDTIRRAKDMGFWTEITTLVIPGKNDSDAELKQIAEFIASVDKSIPWHISRFFPMYKMLDLPQTSMASLLRAYEAGKRAGLEYVYVGNIPDEKYERTFCPKCRKLVIDRAWHAGKVKIDLDGDKCPGCSTLVEGVFR